MPLTDPVPSSAFDVLERNVQDTDKFVNQETGTFTNRVGKQVKPIPVIEAEANATVISLGWHQVGLFADGFTYTLQNDIAKDAAGDWYRWNGTLPKIVAAGALPSSDVNFVKIDYKSHAELTDRNPADGSAHNANDVAKDGGGSVQDFIDAQATTVAELATGKFKVGTYVRLIDRDMALFLVKSGGAYDGIGILNAGNSNTATFVNTGITSIASYGAVDDYFLDDGTVNPSPTDNYLAIQYAINDNNGAYVHIPKRSGKAFFYGTGLKAPSKGIRLHSWGGELYFNNVAAVAEFPEFRTSAIYQVLVDNDAEFILDRVKIKNIRSKESTLINVWKSYKTCIEHCELDNANGNTLFLFNEIFNCDISHNTFRNCVKNHISYLGESEAEYKRGEISESFCNISHNKFLGTEEENGIFVGFALQKFIIDGNIFEDIGDSGIEYGGAPRGEFGTKYTVISNNIIRGTGKFKPGPGILLAHAAHVRGGGNIVQDAKYGCQVVLGSYDVDISLTAINSEITGFLCDNSSDITANVHIMQAGESLRINGSKNVLVNLYDYSFDKCVITQNHFASLNSAANVKVVGRSKVTPTFDTANNNYLGLVYNIDVEGENFSSGAIFDTASDWFTVTADFYNSLSNGDEIVIIKQSATDVMPQIGGAGLDDAFIANGDKYWALKAPADIGLGVYPIRLCGRPDNVQYLDIFTSGVGSFKAYAIKYNSSKFSNELQGRLIKSIGDDLPRNLLRYSNSFEATYAVSNNEITITSHSAFSLVGWELGSRDSLVRNQIAIEFEYMTSDGGTILICGAYTDSSDRNPSLSEKLLNLALPISAGVYKKVRAVATITVGAKPLLHLGIQAGSLSLPFKIKNIVVTQVGGAGFNHYTPTDSLLKAWVEPILGSNSNPPSVDAAHPVKYKISDNWFNSTSGKLFVFNNSSWVQIN